MHESRESERLFPEQINHVFKIIDPFFTKNLVLSEWVCFVASFPFKILAYTRGGKLRFAHGHGKPEGKYRVDETMRIADANETFPAKATDLIRVIGDNMHLLDQLHLRNTARDFRVDLIKVTSEEFLSGLLFLQKVGPRYDQPNADNLLIKGDEPRPVELFLVKNQCVVFRIFARSAGVANSALDLREKSDMFVVAADIFGTGHALVGEKGRLPRTIEHYLRFEVLAATVWPANCH